jgi:hypothetical protein
VPDRWEQKEEDKHDEGDPVSAQKTDHLCDG